MKKALRGRVAVTPDDEGLCYGAGRLARQKRAVRRSVLTICCAADVLIRRTRLLDVVVSTW
jgi:hypothetical protein